MVAVGEGNDRLIAARRANEISGRRILEAQEAAIEKQMAAVRKEAEKVKGGEDRVEEIIAGKMRDFGISESAGARRAIRRDSSQFGAIRLAQFFSRTSRALL